MVTLNNVLPAYIIADTTLNFKPIIQLHENVHVHLFTIMLSL